MTQAPLYANLDMNWFGSDLFLLLYGSYYAPFSQDNTYGDDEPQSCIIWNGYRFRRYRKFSSRNVKTPQISCFHFCKIYSFYSAGSVTGITPWNKLCKNWENIQWLLAKTSPRDMLSHCREAVTIENGLISPKENIVCFLKQHRTFLIRSFCSQRCVFKSGCLEETTVLVPHTCDNDTDHSLDIVTWHT